MRFEKRSFSHSSPGTANTGRASAATRTAPLYPPQILACPRLYSDDGYPAFKSPTSFGLSSRAKSNDPFSHDEPYNPAFKSLISLTNPAWYES
jgi:hypothetical protein